MVLKKLNYLNQLFTPGPCLAKCLGWLNMGFYNPLLKFIQQPGVDVEALLK